MVSSVSFSCVASPTREGASDGAGAAMRCNAPRIDEAPGGVLKQSLPPSSAIEAVTGPGTTGSHLGARVARCPIVGQFESPSAVQAPETWITPRREVTPMVALLDADDRRLTDLQTRHQELLVEQSDVQPVMSVPLTIDERSRSTPRAVAVRIGVHESDGWAELQSSIHERRW
jgi:hypothetical protein